MATLVELAATVISSRAGNTNMTADELIADINKVHMALKALDSGEAVPGEVTGAAEEAQQPVISLKQAFKKDQIVCMVCGKGGFKTLARHLNTAHGMQPKDYRHRFNIPRTQALSAKNYTESRRAMAIDRGLADNLTKARAVRKANIEARKNPPKSLKELRAATPAPAKVTKPVKAPAGEIPKVTKAAKAPKGVAKAKAA